MSFDISAGFEIKIFLLCRARIYIMIFFFLYGEGICELLFQNLFLNVSYHHSSSMLGIQLDVELEGEVEEEGSSGRGARELEELPIFGHPVLIIENV